MTRFRLLRQIEQPEYQSCLGYRGYIDELCLRYFPGDNLQDRFARALAKRRAVAFKEVLEAFEFFDRVRRYVRGEKVADLCAGHGLVGVLFALFERRVEKVTLVDRKPPKNRQRVLDAALEVGPWTAEKIVELDATIERAGDELDEGTAVVAVHACGLRTDACIELGLALRGPIAVMPCCRPHARSSAPPAVIRGLGADLAFDVDRTYRMENAGYQVRWDAIPEVVTPMNRVLIGRPR